MQLLLHNGSLGEDGDATHPQRPWQFWHPFVNVSVTSSHCSVVCPRRQADTLFAPILAGLGTAVKDEVSISTEDFSVIMIGGEGLEAGQRVLELTSPLAMAGIPIFFFTSYWSDFILVPLSARVKVIHALEQRGFVFEAEADGEAGLMTNPASPLLHPHQRNTSSTSSLDFVLLPGTPPPTSVSELQTRTFATLKQKNISPRVDRTIELVTCAGLKEPTVSSSAAHFTEGKLQLGLVKCLTTTPPPRFLSLTLTDTESVSLTLERRLLPLFFNDGEDLLLGKDGPVQIPITLDFENLPAESTGLVCGVASRLIDGMRHRLGADVFDTSYLSTTRAGHVIVYEDELDNAMECLRGAERNGVVGD